MNRDFGSSFSPRCSTSFYFYIFAAGKLISLIKPVVKKMKRITFFIALIFSTFIASSQIQLHAYRVTFADKNNSPYSIERPEEFLSPRALDKRARFNIPVTEEDLPVNPQYLTALQNVDSRIQLLSVSKWTNTATILCPDTMVITGVQMLPFVTSTLKVAKYDEENTNPVSGNRTNHASTLPKTDIDTTSYGYTFGQIAIHNGHLLHDAGFRGEGMLIAVLDGGWLNMDNIGAFQSLYENNQIVGTYDLIPYSDNVYTMHGHGTLVTSEMAVSLQDTFVGAAPLPTTCSSAAKTRAVNSPLKRISGRAARNWPTALARTSSARRWVTRNSQISTSTPLTIAAVTARAFARARPRWRHIAELWSA